MGQSPAVHSTELHKEAFELYFDLQSMNAVSNQMGIETRTLRRWRDGEINCNCPYHNWDALLAEREAATKKKMELIAEGIVDPLVHEQALMDLDPCQITVTPEDKQVMRAKGGGVDRTDLERLAHYEFLYSKLFHHITGVVLDHGTLVDLQGNVFDLNRCKQYFETKGLSPKSLESCLKAFIDVTDEIKALREDLGLRRARANRPVPAPSTPAQPPKQDQQQAQLTNKPAITIQDLRDLKNKMEAMAPEERRALAAKYKEAEENTIEIEIPIT